MRMKPIAAAIAAVTVLGLPAIDATAQVTNPISFDPDGKGNANNAIQMQTFDWAVSSLLSTTGVCPDNVGPNDCNKMIPITDVVNPTHLKTLTHAALQPLVDANGNPTGLPIGLNTDFELTFVAGSCIVAQPVPAQIGFAVNLSLDTSSRCRLDPADPNSASSHFFEIWYDDLKDGSGVKSDALTGQGYRDGKMILSGNVVTLTGNNGFTSADNSQPLDQFGPDNYPGTATVQQQGSTSINILVGTVDKDFFKSGVDHGSIIPFTGEVRLPYRETNPSANFYTGATPTPDHAATLGAINGLNGPDFEQQADASNSFTFVPPEQACRVTGGGNDTSGLTLARDGYDGTVATDKLTPSKKLPFKGKKSAVVTPDYFYSFGGQAGANTAQLPQPKGQWEHNQHSSPTGLQFAFHGGKNAPDGTQIDEIRCTDPGWCVQARPAPDKQIDFVGIGTFSNISGNTSSGDGVVFPGIENVVPEPKTGQPGLPVPTYHWFQVHIEDLGEPGSQANAIGATCPPKGSGNDPFANPPVIANIADCDCADFYRITIYKGNKPALNPDGSVKLDATGNPIVLDAGGNETSIDKTNKIYEVYGYIDGGNFQIHPLTGFDLH